MRIFIEANQSFSGPLRWTLSLVSKHAQTPITFVEEASDADITYEIGKLNSQPINEQFYTELAQLESFDPMTWLQDGKHVCFENGEIDQLSSIFFYVNCLQELTRDADLFDQFGRFKYNQSIQFKNNTIKKQTAQDLIFRWLQEQNIQPKQWKSVLFLSHDIDSLYGSFLQDGFWALKNGRLDVLFKICVDAVLRKPHWRNIDKMLAVNNEYDIKTTFFWLVEKGEGLSGISNADYRINQESELLQLVADGGHVNGIHKAASKRQIDNELESSHYLQPYNRFHFLRFNPSKDWSLLSDSKVLLDVSLGFAEHYGFRNGYGWSFKPYDFKTKSAMDISVAPLIIMDRTLYGYMNATPKEACENLITFLDQHKNNTIWSILWHNIFYSDFKFGGYLSVLRSILIFAREEGISHVLPEDII